MIAASRALVAGLAATLLPACGLMAQVDDPSRSPPPGRALLPDEACVAIEIDKPKAALAAMLAAAGAVPEGLPPAVQGQLALGLSGMAAVLGGTPAGFVERLAAGGAVLGLLPHAGRLVPIAITKPGDAAAAVRWLKSRIGEERYAQVGEYLLIVGNAGALPRLRERLARSIDRSVEPAETGRWAAVDAAAVQVDGVPACVRAVVDVEGLRRHFGARWPEARPVGLARFLLLPLAHAVDEARWLRVSIAGGDQLAIDWQVDVGLRGGAAGDLLVAQRRPLPRLPADTLAAFRLERSLHRLFAEPERFLTDDEVLGVQGFLSIADGLDGPRTSFVEHGLGGLAEPIDVLVFGPTAVPPGETTSPLQLPQFAFVTTIVGAATEAMLLRMTRVFATIVNAERTGKGKRAFLVRARTGDDGGHGLVAEPREWLGPGRAPVEQQVTPTLWFRGPHVALASSEAAAIAAVRAAAGGQRAAAARDLVGDRLLLRGPAVAAALLANHAALVLARVLDEGELPAAADEFFRVLECVVAEIASLELTVTAGRAGTGGTVRICRTRANEAPVGEGR